MNHVEDASETTPVAQTSAEEVEKTASLSRDEGWVAENHEDVEQDQEESEHPEEPEAEEQCAADFVEVNPRPSESNPHYILFPSCIPCFPRGRGNSGEQAMRHPADAQGQGHSLPDAGSAVVLHGARRAPLWRSRRTGSGGTPMSSSAAMAERSGSTTSAEPTTRRRERTRTHARTRRAAPRRAARTHAPHAHARSPPRRAAVPRGPSARRRSLLYHRTTAGAVTAFTTVCTDSLHGDGFRGKPAKMPRRTPGTTSGEQLPAGLGPFTSRVTKRLQSYKSVRVPPDPPPGPPAPDGGNRCSSRRA
jgi:hypothetical protein